MTILHKGLWIKQVSLKELPEPLKERFKSRVQWGARRGGTTNPLNIPVPLVVIHHTGTNNCSTQMTCKKMVKKIQIFHMQNRKWSDIAYNFLIGGDGYIYEGRGWKTEGSHALKYNYGIGIAFVGNFSEVLPEENHLKLAQELIKYGVKKQYIIEGYELVGMCQIRPSESPGRMLINEIKTWPHYVDELTL